MKRTSCGTDAVFVPKVLVPIGPGRAYSTIREVDRTVTEEQGQPTQSPPAQHGPAEANGLAVASLVCGILGVVFPFIPLIPSILAIIFAGRGKRQIDSSGGLQTGRGLAVAGQVLGWVGIALVLVAILGLVALVAVFSGGSVEGGWDFGPARDLR